MKRAARTGLLLMYGAAMLWLLFGQRMWDGSVSGLQLRPFCTIQRFWYSLCYSENPAQQWMALRNLAGNVVLFIPLGYLLPWQWAHLRKFWRHILWMCAVISLVEVLQWATGLGWCDVDDLLLNVAGTSIGFLLWKWHQPRQKQTRK